LAVIMADVPSTNFTAQVAGARFQALEGQVHQLQARIKSSAVSPSRAAKEAQLRKATEDFEGIFINFLLQRMREATPKSGFLDSSQAHDIFTSMYDDEVSRQIGAKGNLGISKMLFEQLKKTL
jgi:Rod binding domain-containing protein